MKNIFLLLISFLFLVSTSAQNKKSEEPKETVVLNKHDKKFLKSADRLMAFKSYYNAIDKYKSFNADFPDHEEGAFKLAWAYYVARDYKNASNHFSWYFSNSEIKKYRPQAYYYNGMTLKSLGKYDEAYKMFSDYVKLKDKSKDAKTLQTMANNEIASYSWIKKNLKEDSLDLYMHRLLGDMNRAYSDFSPYPIHHDTVVFASMDSDSIIKYTHFDTEVKTVKLYETVRLDSTNWSQPIELKEYNTEYAHTANGTLSPDEKYFYFTRCTPDKDNEIECKIYYVEYDTDKIKQHKAKEVEGVNFMGFSTTQPTFQLVTKKGKGGKIDSTFVMYFSSNRPKSKGFDLWYAVMEKHGKFKKPANCGNLINTIGDEVTPFFDNSENTLYFSSNYHWGFGAKDIFKTSGTQNRWIKPQNLMFPVNSSYDDTYYIPALKKSFVADAGYLVSNRPGGIALHSETCCDDIYYYKDKPVLLHKYNGTVYNEVDTLGLTNEQKKTKEDYYSSLNALAKVDTNINVSNFKKIMKRKFVAADSVLLQKVELKKSLLRKDTTAFKPQSFKKTNVLPNTSVGVIKKTVYNQLLQNNDTSFTSISEQVVWVDTTDKNGNFSTTVKNNKDYVYVFKEKNSKHKIKNLNIKSDTIDAIVLEKQKTITLVIAEQPSNTLSKNIDKLENSKSSETVLVLDNLYFDFDSDVIKDESRPVLNLLLNFLNKKTSVKMEIMGHTDSRGTEEHNLDLSQRRAESVMSWLIANGIDEKRLSAKGYGESKPVMPNENPDGSDNPENRAKNRRTEVKIINQNK
ncbi:MAG: OmpA family protein [Cytophagales bacterium]